MPKRDLDPKDRKATPTGLRAARKNARWVHVDRVGDFDPDRLISKHSTTVLRDDERAAGISKIDHDTRFEKGKGVVHPEPDGDPMSGKRSGR